MASQPMAATQATCAVVHARETYHGKQDLDYFAGISAESAPAPRL